MSIAQRKRYYALERKYVTDEDRELAKVTEWDHYYELPLSCWRESDLDDENFESLFHCELNRMRQRGYAKRAFMEANPAVKLRKEQHGAPCGHLLDTGRKDPPYGCSSHNPIDCGQQLAHICWRDHPSLWKTQKGVSCILLIAHPYFAPDPDNPEHVVPDHLKAVRLPSDYSWHEPGGGTALVFIARPPVINSLNLDYKVPAMEGKTVYEWHCNYHGKPYVKTSPNERITRYP